MKGEGGSVRELSLALRLRLFRPLLPRRRVEYADLATGLVVVAMEVEEEEVVVLEMRLVVVDIVVGEKKKKERKGSKKYFLYRQ